jgi:hypothetical protein
MWAALCLRRAACKHALSKRTVALLAPKRLPIREEAFVGFSKQIEPPRGSYLWLADEVPNIKNAQVFDPLKLVGWVERQRYPSFLVATLMGFAKSSTHPTGCSAPCPLDRAMLRSWLFLPREVQGRIVIRRLAKIADYASASIRPRLTKYVKYHIILHGSTG